MNGELVDHFSHQNGELHCDQVPASELVERFGSPLYVYCERTIQHHFQALCSAFAPLQPLICYSVKANSNLSLLRLLKGEGAGFDVVSGGELDRVLEIGGSPETIVYAGVGKTTGEIIAAIRAGILLFNVESPSELVRISKCAEGCQTVVGVAIRVNPDVDPKTHRYITTGKRENKFGIDLQGAKHTLQLAADLPGVICQGLHLHLGSQITDTEPYVIGIQRVLDFIDQEQLLAKDIQWLDIGGGFGVHYQEGEALPAGDFAAAIIPLFEGRSLRLVLEPGRFIMANAGVLLTRVITVKESGGRRFAICDAGMNDLLRPALYQAYHKIWPVQERIDSKTVATDVVGPICETGDFLGLDRELPLVAEGDILCVYGAGAYGISMASNYNTRNRPAEVAVNLKHAKLIRRRETLEDLLRTEREIL